MNGSPHRVVVHGLTHFCRKLPALLNGDDWDVTDHSQHRLSDFASLPRDLARCDLIYLWGGRVTMGKFLWACRCFGNKKIIMLWSGSDVLFAREQLATRKIDPWIADKIHWAVSPVLTDEVRALGLRCEYVQASFVEAIVDPKPLPEKFAVLVFLPCSSRASLYGWDFAAEVAKMLPSIQFNLVGLKPGDTVETPPNVKVHRWMNDLNPIFERTTVLWRPVRHDAGTSFMVLEALAHGRHVIYSYPHAGCIRATNSASACVEIERLRALHDAGTLNLNHAGVEYIGRHCSRAAVRSEILRRWKEIIVSPEPLEQQSTAIHLTGDKLRDSRGRLPRGAN